MSLKFWVILLEFYPIIEAQMNFLKNQTTIMSNNGFVQPIFSPSQLNQTIVNLEGLLESRGQVFCLFNIHMYPW